MIELLAVIVIVLAITFGGIAVVEWRLRKHDRR